MNVTLEAITIFFPSQECNEKKQYKEHYMYTLNTYHTYLIKKVNRERKNVLHILSTIFLTMLLQINI